MCHISTKKKFELRYRCLNEWGAYIRNYTVLARLRLKIPQIWNLTNYYNTLTFQKLEFDYVELDIVESCTDRQAISEELLATVLATVEDTLSSLGMEHLWRKMWGAVFRSRLVPGVLSYSFPHGDIWDGGRGSSNLTSQWQYFGRKNILESPLRFKNTCI